MNLFNIEERRAFCKGLRCNHMTDDVFEDENGTYRKCDKNNKECMLEGRCPMPKGG